MINHSPFTHGVNQRILALMALIVLSTSWAQSQDLCQADTSFTDILFLIDNSQSIDDQEFDLFSSIILRTIAKVQDKCVDSQLGLVHYGGAFGREMAISFDFTKSNQINEITRQFCTVRNSSGFCSEGGGDDLNYAIGEIITALGNGALNHNPMNKFQLVIFTDAFGFDEECTFINCSVIRPFTNIDRLKTMYDAQVSVVGASSQAEASLLAIYASPGGNFDNVQLYEDCQNTVDGCAMPRKYIPIEFDSPVETTSDSIAAFVECSIDIIQVVNPELGVNRSICGDMNESATLTVSLTDVEGTLTYAWSHGLPAQSSVDVSPSETTTYSVTVTDPNGCTGSDQVTVFVESCVPDCSPDTSYTDIIFLIDNSQSIDESEFESFENIILTTMKKVEAKCQKSQLGLVHYGGAFGQETFIQYDLSSSNTFTSVERKFCTVRNSSGFCSEGGGDDLNNAIGDIVAALNDGTLNRNPINKLRLVIFTDAFGFEDSCSFINCSVIRPFTNIDILKRDFNAKVTVVGASAQAEASLLAIYASPGGNFDNVQLYQDCSTTFDGCATPRKYIPIEFDSPVEEATDSIVACVDCTIEILPGFIVDLGEDQTICSDLEESATITADPINNTGEVTYLWDNGLPGTSSVVVQPDQTTTYTVSATDGIGCMTTTSITVIVEDCVPDCDTPPVFSSCPDAYETCPGNSIDPSVSGNPVVVKGIDTCPELVLTYTDDTTAMMGCSYILQRTWSASYLDNTDPNLVSTCVQIIEVMDMTAPEIIGLPEDITIDSDQSCTAIVTWPDPSATDNCGLQSLMSNITSGSVFDVGTTQVIYTAIDACGNISMGSFDVTVIEACCMNAPIITCPETYIGCPNGDIDPAISGMATAISGAETCPEPILTYTDELQSGFTACDRVILRTWTASYPGISDGALTSTCVQTIILVDEENPSIINIPDNIEVNSDNNCKAFVAWTDPDAQDNCGIQSLTSNIANGSQFDIGTTTVIYTATDACGNTNTASFTVTVLENCCVTPPTIMCPEDYTACPGSKIDPAVTGVATALPGSPECPDPGISFTDEEITDGDGCTITIRRTWKATYPGVLDADMSATCVQIIVLTDTEAPVIRNIPDNITIDSDEQCRRNVTWPSPSASDDCGNPSLESNYASGSVFEIGTTTVTYTATDACGNTSTASFTVTVIENCCRVPPVLSCPEDYTGCPEDALTPDVTGMASTISGDPSCPTPEVTYVDQTINDSTNCLTVIERTWTASYIGYNNEAITTSCIQRITLADNEAPIISGMPENMVIASDQTCLASVSWVAPIAIDNCEIMSLTSDIPSGHIFEIGTTVVTYTAMDKCDNTTVASFTITVTKACCQETPSITCPEDYNGCIGTSTHPDVTGYAIGIGGGAYCQEPVITYTDETVSEGINGQITIQRTWKATDPIADTLMVACTQLIVIEDTQSPVIGDCPDDVTLDPDDPIHTWNTPEYSDDCEVSITVNIESGSVFPTGTTTVIYTVTDLAGNEVSCSFDVTVPEEVQIVCPDDMVVRCIDDLNLDDLPMPQVETNCPMCTEDNIPGFQYMGFFNGQSYYISDRADDWQDARRHAEAAGGRLLIITSAEENDYITSIFPGNSAFIGLQDYDEEGVFVWVDGSKLSYSNWYSGQPNNYGNRQDYVEIMRNGQWNDQSNNKSLRYIIEVDCTTLTRSLDNIEEIDGVMNYTVTYRVVDRCGTDDECSFVVRADNTPKFECPDDIVLNVAYGWTRVSWEDPVYNTCCTICPRRNIPGYIYMGNRGDSYYYCSAGRASWRVAERRAKEIGGTLAIVTTKEENDYISARIIRREAYIGLTDREDEGTFRWVDGTAIGFSSWSANQPDADGDYVHLNENGVWYDDDGSKKLEFVVEIKGCDHVDQIGGPISGSTFRTGTTTITYRAADGCGGVDTCSFDITIIDEFARVSAESRSGEKEVQESGAFSFDLYPNPVSSILYLDLRGGQGLKSVISIYQSDGQLMNQHQPQITSSEKIDVSNYPSGLYFIKVTQEDGHSVVKKFTVDQ